MAEEDDWCTIHKKMIDEIVSKKTPVYFISPHIDDALLSAGSLIFDLSKKVRVHIVTVFSGNKDQNEEPSKRVSQMGQSILERKKIEKKLVKGQNITLHYLTFPEWAIREDTSSFERALSQENNVNKNSILVSEIKDKLKTIVQGSVVVFCPLGVGGHIDHLIVRKACVEIIKQNDLYFWEDYPYSVIFKQYHDSFIAQKFYQTSTKYVHAAHSIQKGIIVHAFHKYIARFFKEKKMLPPIFPETYYRH